MLSSLAVIQPGNEQFSGVCFSSRAPFAEVGLQFCDGVRLGYLQYLQMKLLGVMLLVLPPKLHLF